ncbi:MAG: hypothetical protein ABR592_07180 [Nitriliruptorales bacterium]
MSYYPGKRPLVGASDFGEGIARLEVQALVSDWEPVNQLFGTFTVEGVHDAAQSFAGLKTTATVSSSFSRDLQDTKAVAVYHDAAGRVVGGAYTYVDFIPAGGKVGIEIAELSNPKNVTYSEIYVQLTNLTLAGS